MPKINANITGRSIESDCFPLPSAKIRIAVIGVGALGSTVCVELHKRLQTKARVEVLMIDPDELHPKNVPLSVAYSSIYDSSGEDVFGDAKVDLLSAHLKTSSSRSVTFIPCQSEIADVGWQDLSGCGLLVTCTDSALSRAETAFISQSFNIPMLDGGVLGSGNPGGRVSSFMGHASSACYLCGVSEDHRARMLGYAASASLGCTVAERTIAMDPSDATVLSIHRTATRLVEAIAEVLNERPRGHSWAARLNPSDDRLNPSDGRSAPSSSIVWQEDRIELSRSHTCPWHERRMNLVSVLPERPLRDSLPAVEDVKLQLPWPVSLIARCAVCGYVIRRPQRLASLRRMRSCVSCGAESRMDPVDCISSVGESDPAAELTPRQLGLPPRHLLFVRRSMKSYWGDREAS